LQSYTYIHTLFFLLSIPYNKLPWLKAKLKKEADVKKTEAIKMTDELRTCKQELLEKLIEEQKKIILKMEEKKGT
jgi:uncharacterized membrane protein